MVLGIDASNIRIGGGVTHLVEILKVANPSKFGISTIHVWGRSKTLDQIGNKVWLIKHYEPFLERSLFYRIYWSKFILPKRLKQMSVEALFIPGGTYLGNFQPFITMSQNLLPFEWTELRRYGFSLATLKLMLLFVTQSMTFRKATGVIFLTEFARNAVLKKCRLNLNKTTIVYHGINEKFFQVPREQRNIQSCSTKKPFRILYVSFIGPYKHQWNLIRAVSKMRKAGYPLQLELIGSPDDKKSMRKLTSAMQAEDPTNEFIHYFKAISYAEIERKYKEADLFAFLSSCETFGQIVTEAMAAGLPIACSNLSAMPEILGSAGHYFDPLKIDSIEITLKEMIESVNLRKVLAESAFQSAKKYSWEKAADQTFEFIGRMIRN
ncbi:glycosyltransferase family 4 protein [Leptospira stimsonii]|uniref:Glycosyl transferase n=1 Tax=Leptospira stimsonii TaxID=2202203 RepID=A0A396ZB60_9LEPT|nr:glycosyltransferase family 1 protein [Leptospira stimsonii]RHX90858.1 glycosyl transferase [Leptospira stimsonii]